MNVAVLGAGQRGRDVTRRCVNAGHTVRLWDDDANVVMDSIDEIERTIDDAALDAIDGTTGLESAISESQVVFDTTDGDTSTRRELLADVEATVDDETLIATGDRSVSVTAVATGLRVPGRAVGINVVERSPGTTIEVVIAEQTTTETKERACTLVEELGSDPLVVRDTPGFAVSRLELTTIAEAIRMVESNVATVEDIDRAASYEREVGPLAHADEIGLDTVLEDLEDLANRLDGRFDPPGLLREKVANGQLGARTGEGFYVWEDGEPTTGAAPEPAVPTRTTEFSPE